MFTGHIVVQTDCGVSRLLLQRGFSLVELLTVLVIMGVLSALAIPHLDYSFFSQRGFYDSARSTIEYAQRSAIASRRFVCVAVNATTGTMTLTRDVALPDGLATINCASPLNLPRPESKCGANNLICAPSGVSFAANVNVIFDPRGRVVTAPNVVAVTKPTITVNSTPAFTMEIEPETGFVK